MKTTRRMCCCCCVMGGLGFVGRFGEEGMGGRVLGVWLLQYGRIVEGWVVGLID